MRELITEGLTFYPVFGVVWWLAPLILAVILFAGAIIHNSRGARKYIVNRMAFCGLMSAIVGVIAVSAWGISGWAGSSNTLKYDVYTQLDIYVTNSGSSWFHGTESNGHEIKCEVFDMDEPQTYEVLCNKWQ